MLLHLEEKCDQLFHNSYLRWYYKKSQNIVMVLLTAWINK